VKWIEAAGGRAVPIRFYASDAELRRIFNSINGLVFPVSVHACPGPHIPLRMLSLNYIPVSLFGLPTCHSACLPAPNCYHIHVVMAHRVV
jgi:hypothetical protein